MTGMLTANRHKKPPTRYRIGWQKRIKFCALCADLQNADALDAAALALQRRMNVQLQRRFDVSVPQHFADAFDIRTVFDAARGKCVPQGMETPVTDAAALQKHGKLVLTGAWVHRPVDQTGHNISVWLHICSNLPQQEQ